MLPRAMLINDFKTKDDSTIITIADRKTVTFIHN